MAGKQYAVIRDFSRVDKFGQSTSYKANDPYSGSLEKWDLDPAGPDGKGPLLAEKPSTTPDSTSKEKS